MLHQSNTTSQTKDRTEMYHVMWRLNKRCNYECAYCFREGVDEERGEEHPDCGRYAPEHISSCFNNTGKRWRIHMTGGEPFLYPRFVELASLLSQRHELSINTNLSAQDAYDFGRYVRVTGVHTINASIHIQELEKRGEGVRRFLERVLFLQEKGFRVKVLYISYPPLLTRMDRDIEGLMASGVRDCRIKVFRGLFEGRAYPATYTQRERRQIARYELSRYEQAILAGRTSFRGQHCAAGHSSFYMDISGNLSRCCTIPDGYGNFFAQTRPFDPAPRKCPARECICPYQGMKFASGRIGLMERGRAALLDIRMLLTGRGAKKEPSKAAP